MLILLALDPALLERGRELEARRDWPSAAAVYLSLYESAEEKRLPDRERFWLLTSLAQVEFERQNYSISRRWLGEAARFADGPADQGRLAASQGALHLVEGRLGPAEAELLRALALLEEAPARAAAWQNLAAVEMQTGRLDLARRHLQQSLALQPEQLAKTWITLSSLEGMLGDWRAAEFAVRRALALEESSEALWNLAVILEKRGKGKEARALRSRFSLAVSPSGLVDVRSLTAEQQVRSR